MWSMKIVCFLFLLAALYCCCKGFLNDDILGFVNLRVTNVAKNTQKSLRPESCQPGRRCRGVKNEFVPNNKYLEALIQVSKGVAEARAITNLRRTKAPKSRIAVLKRLVKSASRGKRYNAARNLLGHALHFEEELGIDKIVPNLRKELGSDGFNKLMSVDGDVSLMFTIDTTGSMHDEIKAAKEIVKSIASYPRKSSVEYVLSPFNDPGYGPVTKYTSSTEFQAAIDNLRARGGGDCEELPFHGIIDAITVGQPKTGSPMYVFTDAGAKDDVAGVLKGTEKYNLDNAIGLAIDFKMPVHFYFSNSPGRCTEKAQTVSSYKDLAEESDGQQFLFNNVTGISRMGSITAASLDGLATIAVGESSAFRNKRSINKQYTIPIDESIDKLIVTVTVTRGSATTVQLLNHLGRPVPKTNNLAMGCVWVVDGPHSGTWNLVVPNDVGTHSFKVTASSVSNINFEHYFIHQVRGTSVEVPVDYPLQGNKAKVKLLVSLKDKINASSLRLKLVGADGSHLSTPVSLSGLTATFYPPLVAFRLLLIGRSIEGNPITRVSREIIKAKNVLLRPIYSRHYLTILRRRRTFALYALHNNGEGEMFEIKVFSSLPGVQFKLSRSRIRVASYGKSYIRVVFKVAPKVSLGESTTVLVTATGLITGVKTRLVTNLLVVDG